MAKIKKALYDELLKIKRQKKGVSAYLIKKGYSSTYANNISKNWATLEVEGADKNVVKSTTTAKPTTAKSKKGTATKTKANSKQPIQVVVDNQPVEAPKELVVNISEGYEVKAEVRVKQLTHPRFFLASLVKILQKSGAKITFNSRLNLNNASEDLSGFSLAINEDHEVAQTV